LKLLFRIHKVQELLVMNTQNIRRIVVIVSVLLFIASPLYIVNTTAQSAPTDLTGKQIALYFGGPTSSESRIALQLD